MSIIKYSRRNEPELNRLLNHGQTANVYLTENHDVYKKYIRNYLYEDLHEYHHYEYLKYLLELSLLEEDSLVIPRDIYYKDGFVRAYTYPYQVGDCIDALYPKTTLAPLLDAIDRLFDKLESMDYLRLVDIHQKNMIYTREGIKLIDLDYCVFEKTNAEDNIAHINHGLIYGILGVDTDKKIIGVDQRISSYYRELIKGQLRASDFLREYINVLSLDGNVKYKRDLSKKLILEDYNGKVSH